MPGQNKAPNSNFDFGALRMKNAENQEQSKRIWVAPVVYEISLEKTKGGTTTSCQEGSYFSFFGACSNYDDNGMS